MYDALFYKTAGQPGIAEFKDRGSRFIAHAYPVESAGDFKKYLQLLKKEHPKAVHHCFAFRIGTRGDNFRVSDDGEPSGAAGKPILGQIDSREMTNTAIIVVRYFGGTLLGVPGLINAYKTVSSLVLQVIPVITKAVEVKYLLYFDYTHINEIMKVIKQCNCTIIAQEIQLFCNITTGIPRSRLTEALNRLKELQNTEIKKLD